jgi:hypothetical protein
MRYRATLFVANVPRHIPNRDLWHWQLAHALHVFMQRRLDAVAPGRGIER